MNCERCKKETPEEDLCGDGTCRECHVSVSFEDCCDKTYDAKLKMQYMGWTREHVLELYPNAKV